MNLSLKEIIVQDPNLLKELQGYGYKEAFRDVVSDYLRRQKSGVRQLFSKVELPPSVGGRFMEYMRGMTPEQRDKALGVALSAETGMVIAGPTSKISKTISKSGWFRSPYDNKLKFEIDDSMAMLKPSFDDFIHSKKTVKLEDILDHPELYEAYPDARNIKIGTKKLSILSDETGSFYINQNKITLPRKSIKIGLEDRVKRYAWEIEPNTVGSVKLTKDGKIVPLTSEEIAKSNAQNRLYAINEYLQSLLHEIQHWIQQREKFGQGGMVGKLTKEQYRKLPGEQEAREVASRYQMSKQERYASPPKRLK